MSEAGILLVEDAAEGVRCLTFNRPDKLNALSEPLVRMLGEALVDADADPAVRVVILTGAGPKAFVAGADIGEYETGKSEAFAAYQQHGREVLERLEKLSKPTIAAVNGYALGGGFEIALCCDVIICADHARFGFPEGKLGLVPGGGGSQRLMRIAGRQVAAHLLLSGTFMSAERAYHLGIASAAVLAHEAMPTALALAVEMMKVSPLAHAAIKKLLRKGWDMPVPDALTFEIETLISLYQTADGQEGIDAFLAKRPPKFVGR